MRDSGDREVLTGQAMSRWYPEARLRTGIGTLAVSLALLGAAGPANGAGRPGTLDRSFGDRGEVVTAVEGLSFIALALGVQADGSILVGGHTVGGPDPQAGHAVVVRFTSSGQLDTSFGAGGVARVPLPRQTNMDALAVGPDGRIVLAGGAPFAPSVTFIRLTVDGAPDMSFGEAGVATVSVGSPLFDSAAAINDVVVQPDGEIVAAGSVGSEAVRGGGGARGMAMRLLVDGRPDPGFGSDGTVSGGSGLAIAERATGVALDSRGGIVVVGERLEGLSTPPGQTLARIPIDDPNGHRFATRSPRGYSGLGADVAIVRDGRIVVSGSAGRPEDFLASVFSPELHFLASRRTNMSRARYSSDVAVAATPDRDGGVLVVGSRDIFSIGLARYAGRRLALDRSFSRDGRATLAFPGKPRVQGVAVQPDGGIVVMAGTSPHDGPPHNVFLARFDGGYDKRRPNVRLTGLPRGCAGRRARLRVRVRDASPLASLTVRIDRRRVRSVAGKRVAVRLWREGSGRHPLTVRARDAAGNETVVRRRFRTCA